MGCYTPIMLNSTVITGPLRALLRVLEHRVTLNPDPDPEPGPSDPGPTDPWPPAACPPCPEPGLTILHDTTLAVILDGTAGDSEVRYTPI